MVRDPCNRFKENASFVTLAEKTRGPVVSDGTTNHETPMTSRAAVEPSNVLRDSRATLHPASRQHLENANIVLKVKSCFQHFQCVFACQQH